MPPDATADDVGKIAKGMGPTSQAARGWSSYALAQASNMSMNPMSRRKSRFAERFDADHWNGGIKRPTEKELDEFYNSWDWKHIRYEFMNSKGRRCLCCGFGVEDGVKIVVDHIRSVRLNWHLRFQRTNLQILCDDCNRGKGNRDETDFRPLNERFG